MVNLLKHTFMKKNMGKWDRVIRTLLALLAIYLFVGGIVTGALGVVLMVLAGVFLFTSFISFCPLYTLVGISTCQIKKASN
jgi:fatty acid desaturase